jgi:hypothetical protein
LFGTLPSEIRRTFGDSVTSLSEALSGLLFLLEIVPRFAEPSGANNHRAALTSTP